MGKLGDCRTLWILAVAGPTAQAVCSAMMKRVVGVLILGILLGGCASTPKVRTDADPAVDFSRYRSYAWLQKPDGTSPLTAQRIVDAVNAQLQAKGLHEAADGQLAVAVHVATEQKQTLETFYDSPVYGGWGWRGGWRYGGVDARFGGTTTTVSSYEAGTLVVDLFDAATRQAVWRGTASGTIPSSPEKLNAGVQAGIAGMFAEFPPGHEDR